MELKLYACIYAFQPVLPLYQHQCSLYKEANHIYFLKQFIQHGHIGQLSKQAGCLLQAVSVFLNGLQRDFSICVTLPTGCLI